MVEWLAGNRIRGTNAERTSTTGFNPVVGVVGGWKLLGRYDLNTTSDTIDVSSLDNKKYYMMLHHGLYSGDSNGTFKFNATTGNEYIQRSGYSGGSAGAGSARANFSYDDSSVHNSIFAVSYIVNNTDEEKIIITHQATVGLTGSGNTPNRAEQAGKWSNATDPIDQITHTQTSGGGDYISGSQVVVLGWDESDTHTDNFWEELTPAGGVTLASASNSLSTGTFTAKRYLWVQYHIPSSTGAANNYRLRVGNNTVVSTGSKYAFDYSINSAGDVDVPTQDQIKLSWNSGGSGSEQSFGNIFIVNNLATEKLFISKSARTHDTGVPYTYDVTGKYVDTTHQINIMELSHQTSASGLGAGTIIKVWGHD